MISDPKAFADAEEQYDAAIGSRNEVSSGSAVYQLWKWFGGGNGGVALEMGAGSGAITRGFVEAAAGFATLVTDPSVTFLELTRKKLAAGHLAPDAVVCYATLMGEDISTLPPCQFDIVFAQACLHHVADWKKFISDAQNVLVPGGILVFQEPFSEGTYLMGLAAEILATVPSLPEADRQLLESMRGSIYLLSDRSVNKDHGEDKHCFYTDEMILTCQEAFGNVRFFRNQSFDSIAATSAANGSVAGAARCPPANVDFHSGREASTASLLTYCASFFRQHYGISEDAMALFDQAVVPKFERLDRLYRQGDGPALLGVVLCRKRSNLRGKADKLRSLVATRDRRASTRSTSLT